MICSVFGIALGGQTSQNDDTVTGIHTIIDNTAEHDKEGDEDATLTLTLTPTENWPRLPPPLDIGWLSSIGGGIDDGGITNWPPS